MSRPGTSRSIATTIFISRRDPECSCMSESPPSTHSLVGISITVCWAPQPHTAAQHGRAFRRVILPVLDIHLTKPPGLPQLLPAKPDAQPPLESTGSPWSPRPPLPAQVFTLYPPPGTPETPHTLNAQFRDLAHICQRRSTWAFHSTLGGLPPHLPPFDRVGSRLVSTDFLTTQLAQHYLLAPKLHHASS
ncbi:UNVERIFIED_CONTAM: hypothetical protein Sangu_2987900 [Sesamum angustifolium]|uniref:Uncharacterized protein n=1 Tax=Sesamum angustifolium TaxID=2727405 RepID=A0AAW2KPT8_9LAMI